MTLSAQKKVFPEVIQEVESVLPLQVQPEAMGAMDHRPLGSRDIDCDKDQDRSEEK